MTFQREASFLQRRCTILVKGHTGAWNCLFLLLAECATAYCSKLDACTLHLLCFRLVSEPMTRKNTHAIKCSSTHAHRRVRILAHNNQLSRQHSHPHVWMTRLHYWQVTDDCHNLSVTHITTVREQLKPGCRLLLSGYCNRWNCSSGSGAGEVKPSRTSWVDAHVLFLQVFLPRL